MVDHVLIDNLNLKARDFALQWKNLVRKAPQLKHHNTMDEGLLIESNTPLYPLLAKTIDRGLDRSLLGGFFVGLGKTGMKDGVPVSELIYTLNIAEKIVIEYVLSEYAPESPVRMYQAMGIITRVSEFFLLGCFYVTKGYLEIVYTRMSASDSVSEELLKKYFKDDFFFRQE